MAQQQQLLLLENALTGWTRASRRKVASIVSKTTQGLGRSGKLFVPTSQRRSRGTHRPEEIVDDAPAASDIVSNPDSKLEEATIQ